MRKRKTEKGERKKDEVGYSEMITAIDVGKTSSEASLLVVSLHEQCPAGGMMIMPDYADDFFPVRA